MTLQRYQFSELCHLVQQLSTGPAQAWRRRIVKFCRVSGVSVKTAREFRRLDHGILEFRLNEERTKDRRRLCE